MLTNMEITQATEDDRDQFVVLHNISWSDFKTLLEMRGETAAPRIAYLDGELQLMAVSQSHEGIKTCIARLLEAYAEERDIDLNGFGSWTLMKKRLKCAKEPDECYIIGPRGARPHLAIEVVLTSGGIHTLEIYRRLEVGEVWFWKRGVISVYLLRGKRYVSVERSKLFPELDLELVARLAEEPSQTQAVRRFRQMLQRNEA